MDGLRARVLGGHHQRSRSVLRGPAKLVREATEPRRQQQQLVDFVRRHLHAVALGGLEHFGRLGGEPLPLLCRARRRHLGAHPTAADEIDAIVTAVPGTLTDHYDPRGKILLSNPSFSRILGLDDRAAAHSRLARVFAELGEAEKAERHARRAAQDWTAHERDQTAVVTALDRLVASLPP